MLAFRGRNVPWLLEKRAPGKRAGEKEREKQKEKKNEDEGEWVQNQHELRYIPQRTE